MKILNETTRDSIVDIQMSKVSGLTETSNLKDESVIHVVEDGNSKKITIANLKQKIFESVQNNLKTAYWDTHIDGNIGETDHKTHVDNVVYNTMLNYLLNRKNPIQFEDKIRYDSTFVQHINYDFSVLSSYAINRCQELENSINNTNNRVDELDYPFSSNMTLTTNSELNVKSNVSVWHNKSENNTYCQMVISAGNKISNEWIVPATGNLVVVGWLDSSDSLNNKGIPSSFCVLEGKINGDWEVLGVQTVIPSKNISYVGFTVSVRENLIVRVRTGFTVGAKSGQYSNEQDGNGTLSNSTANGFKCQVFSRNNN